MKCEKDLIKAMKALKIYNANFKTVINVAGDLLAEYYLRLEEFKNSGESTTIVKEDKNGVAQIVKNPKYSAIEKIRLDLLSYLRELGLTPQGLKKIVATNDKTGDCKSIDSVLSGL